MNLLCYNGQVKFNVENIEAVTGGQNVDLSYLMENILSLVSKFGSTSHHHIVVKVCLWFCLISFKKNREILVYMSHVKRKETFVKIIQFEKKKIISRLVSDFVGFQDEFKIQQMRLRLVQVTRKKVLDVLYFHSYYYVVI